MAHNFSKDSQASFFNDFGWQNIPVLKGHDDLKARNSFLKVQVVQNMTPWLLVKCYGPVEGACCHRI